MSDKRVGKWAVVRRADAPTAMPFVVSEKDWGRMEVQQDG